MSRLDPRESFAALKQNVQDSIKSTFPQVGDKHTLDVEDVEVMDQQSSADYTSQKKAKMTGRTWGVPVQATLVLKDTKTGKVIDRKKRKIATLPKVTNRYSYIVDGSEFQVDGQWRLRPGVYTKVKANGELDSFFNVKGRPLHMGFDPKDRKFKVQLGGAKPPLYPIMKAMGVSDDTLERKWGKEILEANKLDTRGKPIKVDKVAIDFAKRLDPKAEVNDYEQAAAVIQENMHQTELNPEVTKRTLGKAISKIDSDAMVRSSGRLLGIARGEEKPDIRDSLMYKDFYGVEDYVGERIDGHKQTIGRRIGNNLDRRNKIDEIVGPDIYNRPIKEFFGKVSLANTPSQTNPLKMISGQMKTTIAGEGGVADANRITEEAKLVDPSHFGVLDPLHTPEGGATGVSLQLALGARKKGNRVVLPLIDAKTGKTKLVGMSEVHDSVVALPDSVKKVGNKYVPKSGTKVLASTAGNEMRPVSMKEVKYVVPKNSQMFSLATNMVPFINSDSPNRATMAGRHMEQAIPLVESEPPLVQSMLGEKSFDEIVGGFSSHHAPVGGKVVKVGKDSITIQKGRKKIDVPIYNNYPLNDKKGVLYSKPVVQKGDTIKEGQLIADTNYSVSGREEVLVRYPDGIRRTRLDELVFSEGLKVLALSNDTLCYEWKPLKELIKHPTSDPLMEVTTRCGRSFRVTASHSCLTVDDDGRITEVCPKDMVEGRTVVPVLGTSPGGCSGWDVAKYGPSTTASKNATRRVYGTFPLSREFGFLLGMYLSEGDLPHLKYIRVGVTNSQLRKAFLDSAARCELAVTEQENTVTIGCAQLARAIDAEFRHGSVDKRLPGWVFASPRVFLEGLIDGIWSGDGSLFLAGDSVCASMQVDSEDLARSTQVILSELGVVSSFSSYFRHPNGFDEPNDWHFRLWIAGATVGALPPLSHPDKERLRCAWAPPAHDKVAVAPMPKNLCRGRPLNVKRAKGFGGLTFLRRNAQGRLGDLVNGDVLWDLVEKVEEVGPEPFVYDLSVGDHETFVLLSGVTVHNTEGGVYAPGRNLRVAYMPWKGLNFEDGVVISETAAQKLMSEHMHKKGLSTREATLEGKKKYQAYYPDRLNKEQAEKLDDDGIVRVGQKVKPGDTLVAALAEQKLTTEQQKMQLLHKSLVKPKKDKAITWEEDFEGEVVEVNRQRKHVEVHVRTKEPMEVGDKLCFDEKTEVLTSEGWKLIADVGTTDRVCCLDHGEIVYESPTDTYAYPRGDKMYRIRSQQVDLLVTLDHNMYVQRRGHSEFELLPAREIIGKRVRYSKGGVWCGEDVPTFQFPALEVDAGQSGAGSRVIDPLDMDMDHFLALLGAFLADGNCVDIPKSGTYGIEFTAIKETKQDELRSFLDGAGIHWTNASSGTKTRIHSKQLLTYFRQFGKAPDKFIPSWVFDLPKERLLVLFHWLFTWGDGYSKEGRPVAQNSVSKRLVDDIQRLALHIGMAANVTVAREAGKCVIKGRECATQRLYDARILTTKLQPQVNHGHTAAQSAQTEEVIDNYDRPVYCLTVPSHVLYVRRNGKPVWSGNCGRHGDKGIVTGICPDHEMPRSKDGNPAEVLMNPIGTPGRMNVGQVLETAAGKVAEKRGETFKVENFSQDDNREFVLKALKKEGLEDKEDLIDPATGKVIPGIQTGKKYILKMEHQVGKKMAARDRDAYDHNLVPRGGGKHGGMAMGTLGNYAMLAHGARCLMGGTTLRTKDGKRVEISDVVKNRRELEVLCADPETKELDYKPVVAWSARVAAPEELCCVSVAASNPSGRKHLYKLKCTENHTIYTDRGKVQAGDLEEGDWLLTPGTRLHPLQRQMILGSVLGDGSLGRSDTFASSYRVVHGEPQRGYCDWKREICAGITRSAKLTKVTKSRGSYSDGPKFRFWTRSIGELSELRRVFYPDGKKVVPQEALDELSEVGLAFWFMDDGNTDIQKDRPQKYRTVRLAMCDYDAGSVSRAQGWFEERWGLHSTVQVKEGKYPYLHFFNENAIRFLKIVAPYIHDDLKYKLTLDTENHGFSTQEKEEVGSGCSSLLVQSTEGLEKVAVLSVGPYEPKHHEDYLVYNIEVEDHHNYVADGVLVGNSNLREMATIKSDKAQGGEKDELWGALQAGEMLPPPKTTFAYQKFNGYLNAMGVDTRKDGNSLQLVPMTDKDVLGMSNGEIKDGGRILKMSNLKPEKGGLFDEKVTGGIDGKKWGHIKLDQPMPNPLFEKAIMSLSGIRGPQFGRLIDGEEGVDKEGNIVAKGAKGAVYGPGALGRLLEKVDVDKDLKAEEERIGGLKGQIQNESRRKIKYLRALKKLKMKPTEAYMTQNVPVLPPSMRPISVMEDGSLQTDDMNELYKGLALVNRQHKSFPTGTPQSVKAPVAASMYDHMKSLTGVGGTLNTKHPGVLQVIAGKEGPKCYDGETEVLTREGWTRLDAYDGAAALATVNLESDLFEWQLPADFTVSEFSGKMYHTEGRDIDLLVTPNHNHVVSLCRKRSVNGKRKREYEPWRLLPVKDLVDRGSRSRMMVAAGGWVGEEPDYTFDGYSVDPESFAEFVGWWIAEGWIGPSTKSSPGYVYLSQCKTEEITMIDEFCMKSLGLPYKREVYGADTKNYDTQVYWWLNNSELAQWLIDNCGRRSEDKKISAEILNWDARYLRMLLMAYMGGDGHAPGSRAVGTDGPYSRISRDNGRFSSTSDQLVGDFQHLCMKIGLRVIEGTPREGPTEAYRRSYRGSIRGFRDTTVGEHTAPTVQVPFSGKVYGPTVPNGTLVVRRNGIPAVSGNSGFVQNVLLKRKQDMTARSTIVPEPSLNLDEAAIPRKAAKEMYKPFIVRELRRSAGATPLQARKMIDEDDPLAKRALDRVVQERPLLLKRDPVLHKYGIQAFKPKLVEGKAIKIHPLVCSGYNADFDGDTMSAFVPVSQEAVKEARKMHPSNNLFSPSSHGVMYAPSHEQQVGLFMATQAGKRTSKTFKDQDALEKAFNANEVGLTDVVKVGGVRTTLGRKRIDSQLPEKLRGGKVLKDLSYDLTKKEQGKLFQLMAEVDQKSYPEAVDKLKDLGNETASKEGFSFGIEDFKVHKDIRDPLLRQAASKAAKLNPNKPSDAQKIVDIYGDAMEKMEDKVMARSKKQKTQLDRLQVAAGIKGNGYRQLTAAPVLFVDGKGEVVPNPVGKSYSEGLDASSYWSATSGGRKGIVQKVQSVSEPGYLTKMMTNSVIDTVVDTEDCETDRGINLSVDEPDAVGRFTTADLKLGRGKTIPTGTLLTPELLTKAKNNKINKVTVRSPMRCNHGKGVCKKCMGLDENGQMHDKGTNVGVTASQALGERGTQLAMRSFHSGGVYEGKGAGKSLTAGGLDRATSLLYLKKKVKGSAVLSPTGGKIRRRKKDPAGGYRVMIGDTEVYVPANRKLLSKVNPGASVKKGEALTSGPVNPHELLPLTGMNKVQGHLAGELHGIYGQYGVRRRNSEVMVRALSNVTKVEDPGDNPDLLPGDFASTTQVYDWNRKNKKNAPVKHTPVLRGVKQIPLDVQEDWMARLNHEHLRSTMIEASQQGWSTDLHGLNPIPPLIHGVEFGKGTKEKPWRY